ncbi:unnamed protein product [Macrosiphum euphorbiae]|uniref:Secreted protein n=1 Tax=Macrosiphum euphorbiae TaxID=13131 RepID=A0AAV0WMF9_9HEMI|nr:unnamed protein product [Macrosiphum euphorbiae]
MIGDNRSRLTRRIVDIGAILVVLQQTCGASATMFHAKSVIGGFGLTTEIADYGRAHTKAVQLQCGVIEARGHALHPRRKSAPKHTKDVQWMCGVIIN